MSDSQLDESNDEVASPGDIRRLTTSLFGKREFSSLASKRKGEKRKNQAKDDSLEFGIRFHVESFSAADNIVVLPDTGFGTLQALKKGFYDFLRLYPHLGMQFIKAFKARRSTPGFPEYVAEDFALETTLESLLLSVPTKDQVAEVRRAFMCTENKSISTSEKDELEEYFVRCVEILTRLSFQRLNLLVRIVRNISRERYEFDVFVAALHLNYVENREITPY